MEPVVRGAQQSSGRGRKDLALGNGPQYFAQQTYFHITDKQAVFVPPGNWPVGFLGPRVL